MSDFNLHAARALATITQITDKSQLGRDVAAMLRAACDEIEMLRHAITVRADAIQIFCDEKIESILVQGLKSIEYYENKANTLARENERLRKLHGRAIISAALAKES